jgi:hypothetical protein
MEVSNAWEAPNKTAGSWLYCGTRYLKRGEQHAWYGEYRRIKKIYTFKGQQRVQYNSFWVCDNYCFHDSGNLPFDEFRGRAVIDKDIRTEIENIFTLGGK